MRVYVHLMCVLPTRGLLRLVLQELVGTMRCTKEATEAVSGQQISVDFLFIKTSHKHSNVQKSTRICALGLVTFRIGRDVNMCWRTPNELARYMLLHSPLLVSMLFTFLWSSQIRGRVLRYLKRLYRLCIRSKMKVFSGLAEVNVNKRWLERLLNWHLQIEWGADICMQEQ